MPLSSVRSVPVSAEAEVYEYVLKAICAGRYRNGDRLIAEDIAGEVGTSRMPVRSAFQRLAAEGLVVLRPNRGAVVSGLDLEAMQEVFEMRSALEGLAARLATAQVGERELTRLERLLDNMDDDQDSPSEWIARHREFHEYLCSLAKRPRLLRQISSLYALIEPHMQVWLAQERPRQTARHDHQAIIDALRSGNPSTVEATLCDHIEGTVPELLAFIEHHAAEPGPR